MKLIFLSVFVLGCVEPPPTYVQELTGRIGDDGFLVVNIADDQPDVATASINLVPDGPWLHLDGTVTETGDVRLENVGVVLTASIDGDALTGVLSKPDGACAVATDAAIDLVIPALDTARRDDGYGEVVSATQSLTTYWCSAASYCYKWCNDANTGQRCRYGTCASNYTYGPASCYYP